MSAVDHELDLESANDEGVQTTTEARPSWTGTVGVALAVGLLGLLGLVAWSLTSDREPTALDDRPAATVEATPVPLPTSSPSPETIDTVESGVVSQVQLPPERRAALDAMYGTTSLEQLQAGSGNLVVVSEQGVFLVDLDTGVAERTITWADEPAGEVLITDHGVVTAPSDGIRFYPWGASTPTLLRTESARLGSSIGDWIITFDPDHLSDTDPMVTNLVTGDARRVRVPVQLGSEVGLLADGSIITAVGGRVFASGDLLAGSFTGELLRSSGDSAVATTCDGPPGSCRTRLFDRVDRRLVERGGLELQTLYSADVQGPISAATSNEGGGLAWWSPHMPASLELRKQGVGDVVRRTVVGLDVGQLHWTPNGQGLFHLPDGGGAVSYVHFGRGEARQVRGGGDALAIAILPTGDDAPLTHRLAVSID